MPENSKSLKPGWLKVKFGDVVRLSKARCADPLAEGIERFVGLEHLEPGDLRIRGWGNVADGVTFTSLFKPGQVLFGKRRAYQRKVAVADFSGVCSGDIYVLESKDANVLLPDLLPFICQTDAFFDHAVGTSAGSLSPRTNWTSLADFKFVLPAIKEQERLVELFHSAVANVESITQTIDAARRLQSRLLIDRFEANELPQKSLDDVLERIIDYRGKSPNKTSIGVPLITARNVRDGFLDFSQTEFIPECEFDSWMTRGMPQIGDVLFTTEAPLGNVARVPDMKFALAQRLVCLRADKYKMYNDYLYWALRSPITQQRVVMRSTGTTVAGVKQSELRKVQLGVPSLDKQAEIAAQLNELERASATLLDRLEMASKIRARLLADYL